MAVNPQTGEWQSGGMQVAESGLGMIPIAGPMIQGMMQTFRSSKINPKRPKYEIAQEAFENQDISRNVAYGRSRAAQNMRDQAREASATASRRMQNVAGDQASLMAGLVAQSGQDIQAARQASTQEAQEQLMGKRMLMKANRQMIDEKDKAFNYNKNMPYQQQVAAKRALRKAGAQNVRTGSQEALDVASTLITGGLM